MKLILYSLLLSYVNWILINKLVFWECEDHGYHSYYNVSLLECFKGSDLFFFRQQKMKEKLIAYQKFENYLTHVLDRMPEGKNFLC